MWISSETEQGQKDKIQRLFHWRTGRLNTFHMDDTGRPLYQGLASRTFSALFYL